MPHRFNTKSEAETAASAVIKAAQKVRAERGDESMVVTA